MRREQIEKQRHGWIYLAGRDPHGDVLTPRAMSRSSGRIEPGASPRRDPGNESHQPFNRRAPQTAVRRRCAFAVFALERGAAEDGSGGSGVHDPR